MQTQATTAIAHSSGAGSMRARCASQYAAAASRPPASQASDSPAVNRTAMSAIAARSSMTAIESSRTRTPGGSEEPTRARTPSAKAMSVATGIAHAPPSAAAPRETAIATTAGMSIPPPAAKNGSIAARRSASWPTVSSRLISRPATKKKSASSASATQSPSVSCSCSQSGPRCSGASRTSWYAPPATFAHSRASTVAAISSLPPLVSSRMNSANVSAARRGSGTRRSAPWSGHGESMPTRLPGAPCLRLLQLRVPDDDADRGDDRPAQRDLDERRAQGDVQKAPADPGDDDELDRDDDVRHGERRLDVGDEEGQGVGGAADERRQPRDAATLQGGAAAGDLTVVGQALGHPHADRRAERRREADEQRRLRAGDVGGREDRCERGDRAVDEADQRGLDDLEQALALVGGAPAAYEREIGGGHDDESTIRTKDL